MCVYVCTMSIRREGVTNARRGAGKSTGGKYYSSHTYTKRLLLYWRFPAERSLCVVGMYGV